jgi:hypothetical protein
MLNVTECIRFEVAQFCRDERRIAERAARALLEAAE